MKSYDVLIIGAGHGGAQAAIALRQGKCEKSIGILSADLELPYERPPLSKGYLAGEKAFERILIRPPQFWDERGVAISRRQRVVKVDPDGHRVTTADGAEVGYGALIWAAGGVPRQLTCTGSDLSGIHSVRTRADVDRVKSELLHTDQVVVIGGGYIGLETAAVLRKLGKQVVVIEALDRVLARVAGEPLSRFFEAEHRKQGVDIRLNAQVDCIVGQDGRVTGVRLANGELLPAKMIIVGIGIVPAVEPLLAAGAVGGNGVKVDEFCRTSLPDVYAIGDCALHGNGFSMNPEIRLESVQNANDMANVVANAVMGKLTAYHTVPWFWSNQYDLKLQTVGISTGHDNVAVRGNQSGRSFSLAYLKDGAVIAMDCVNSVADYVKGRDIVISGAEIDLDIFGDVSKSLKDAIK